MSQPFKVSDDSGAVVITTASGETFGITADQALELIDDLGDAADSARSWQAWDPFERDQTDEENR